MSMSVSLRCCTTTTLLLLLLTPRPLPLPLPLGFFFAAAAGAPKGGWASPSIPVSGVIIPGFASSRLRAWALLDCPYSPLDFRPLDPVWLDTKKVLIFFWFFRLVFLRAQPAYCKLRGRGNSRSATEYCLRTILYSSDHEFDAHVCEARTPCTLAWSMRIL